MRKLRRLDIRLVAQKVAGAMASELLAFGLVILLMAVLVWSLGAILIPYIPFFAPGYRSVHILGILTVASSALFIYTARLHPLIGRGFGLYGGESDAASLATVCARLLFLAFLAGICMGGAHRLWHARLDTLRQQAHENTLPTTLSDFHIDHTPETNAYPALDRIIKKLDTSTYSHMGRLRLGLGRWDALSHKRVHSAAQSYGHALKTHVDPSLTLYTHYSANDYRKAPGNPYTLTDVSFSKLMMLGNLSFYLATSAAYNGPEKAAWPHINRCLQLAQLAGTNPTLPAQTASLTIERRCIHGALNVMLNRQGAILPSAISQKIKAALMQEKIRQGMQFRLAQVFDLQSHEWEAEEFGLVGARVSPLFRAGWRIIAAAGAVDAGLAAHGQILLKELLNKKKDSRTSGEYAYWPFFFEKTRIRLNYQEFRIIEKEHKAWMQMALVYSALNAYRRSRGRYPPSLSQLIPTQIAPNVLQDPFGSGPFGYATQNGEALLRSLGFAGNARTKYGRTFEILLR